MFSCCQKVLIWKQSFCNQNGNEGNRLLHQSRNERAVNNRIYIPFLHPTNSNSTTGSGIMLKFAKGFTQGTRKLEFSVLACNGKTPKSISNVVSWVTIL